MHAEVAQGATKAGRDAIAAGGQPPWGGCGGVSGYETIDRVREVDQTPIGKTPSSCPATCIGFWDMIRKLLAGTLEARARGYGLGRFSFNIGNTASGGGCRDCDGQGLRTIETSFLPDVKVPCDTCHGQRFNAVSWRGRSIGEVLKMEVDEVVEFLAAMPGIAYPLRQLKDVSLGCLTLGRAPPVLSGSEAQRIKLVSELVKLHDDLTRRGPKAPHTLCECAHWPGRRRGAPAGHSAVSRAGPRGAEAHPGASATGRRRVVAFALKVGIARRRLGAGGSLLAHGCLFGSLRCRSALTAPAG